HAETETVRPALRGQERRPRGGAVHRRGAVAAPEFAVRRAARRESAGGRPAPAGWRRAARAGPIPGGGPRQPPQSRREGSPPSGRIAVKVINQFGDEVLKVYRVPVGPPAAPRAAAGP